MPERKSVLDGENCSAAQGKYHVNKKTFIRANASALLLFSESVFFTFLYKCHVTFTRSRDLVFSSLRFASFHVRSVIPNLRCVGGVIHWLHKVTCAGIRIAPE